ncbi:MAG: hypothetical protein ACRCX7_09990 [Cetobacterium sp.]|uniref:hypothetical protein n=1 Tax=Cetobacterium sp. TaxID=2071632 RepID=UPI003F3C7F16
MRVKCINKGKSTILEVGEEYEVFEEVEGKYLILTKLIGTMLYLKEYFEIIKEDKVEEVRVVRKLEDLEGLPNGFGLKLNWNEDEKRIESKKDHNIVHWITTGDIRNLGAEYCFNIIKSLGFRFEYKPLRTIEEVVAEMRTKEIQFTFNGDNCYIKHVASYNKYYVSYDCHDNIIGAIYLDKETASKYCIELNEILKGGK